MDTNNSSSSVEPDRPVAIVTGGSQGLGAAICIELLELGYKVCVADIQIELGKTFVVDLQKRYGTTNVIFSACDVTKQTDFKRTFEETRKAFLKIDLLVNNAGVNFCDATRIILTNMIGTLNGCETAINYMSKDKGGKGGMVINIASVVGLKPSPRAPAYSASKHGVVGLTRSYGDPLYFNKHGITFAALCPSMIDTSMLKTAKELNLFANAPERLNSAMSPEFAAKGILKLLEDKINGSILLLTPGLCNYVGYPEELKSLR